MTFDQQEISCGLCDRKWVRYFFTAVAGLILIVAMQLLGRSESEAAQKGDDQIGAPVERRDVAEFMALKLKAAQLTLEGVMTNRFQQIQHNASAMVDLSRHAAWKQMASPTYIQDTADFVAAAEYLNRVATAEDAEATSMAFNRVMDRCASCHQHVRTPRVADSRPDEKSLAFMGPTLGNWWLFSR